MSSQTNSRRQYEYFGALDGFRGILAVCVAIYHTFWFSNINSTAFFNNGPVVIDLFFVFSGFLLFRLYNDKLSTGQGVMTFFKRRFARLYPLHLFMFAVFLLYAFIRLAAHWVGVSTRQAGEILPFQPGAPENIWSVLSHLTLTHSMGVHDTLTFNPPSWTISVEFFAYFTFAALLFLRPIRSVRDIMALSVFIAVIYFGLSRVKPDMNITYDYGFWRCLGGFYTGVIGAWLYARRLKNAERTSQGPVLATILEFAALFGYISFVIYCPGKLQFFIAPVALFFIYIFAFDAGWISKFMSNRLFRYLAKISYSVYMVHVIISIFFYIAAVKIVPAFLGENWFENSVLGDLYLIPYLMVVFVCSHLTWKYVEMPGKRWMEGFKIWNGFPSAKPAIDSKP